MAVVPQIAKTLALGAALALLFGAGCRGPRARSERSFDEIQELVRGKTAEQLLTLLGEPDSRQVIFDADERWVWWNYTFLDGRDCPPELRGRVVHLEIVIKNPVRLGAHRRPYSEWQVDDAFGITYRSPFTDG
ncbi:MAG TPA: hypothetical protein DD490_31270 [Acidobacteria bacterium]|nr:hypothetical protein [Acidobacteriota bacterium]